MSEPPADMPIELGHDGVVWTLGARPFARELAVLSIVTAGALLGTAAIRWWLALIAIAPAVVAFAAAAQAARRTRVRVTDRAVIVEARTLGGTEVTRVALDELTGISVQVVDGDAGLVVRTRRDTVVIGVGRPREEVDWMIGAVGAAQEAFGRREQAEGREWTFLRRVPEGLTRLRE